MRDPVEVFRDWEGQQGFSDDPDSLEDIAEAFGTTPDKLIKMAQGQNEEAN